MIDLKEKRNFHKKWRKDEEEKPCLKGDWDWDILMPLLVLGGTVEKNDEEEARDENEEIQGGIGFPNRGLDDHSHFYGEVSRSGNLGVYMHFTSTELLHFFITAK